MMSNDLAGLMIPDLPVSEDKRNEIADHNAEVTAVADGIAKSQQAIEDLLVGLGPELTLQSIRKEVDKLRSAIHDGLRQLVAAAVKRHQILQGLTAGLEKRLHDFGGVLDRARVKTGKALEQAGQGASDQPMAQVNPKAAERRFQHLVESSTPVQTARAQAETAAADLKSQQRLLQSATAVIDEQRANLQQVTRHLLGI